MNGDPYIIVRAALGAVPLLPGFVLLAIGMHLSFTYFRSVPLSSFAVVAAAPFALYRPFGEAAPLLAMLAISMVASALLAILWAGAYRSGAFRRSKDETRLALEIILQTAGIGLVAALAGTRTHLAPPLDLFGTRIGDDQAALFVGLGVIVLISPLLFTLTRRDKLVISAEDPYVFERLRIAGPLFAYGVAAVSLFAIWTGAGLVALDRGYSVYGNAALQLFALALALVAPPGRLITLVLLCVGLLFLRSVAIVTIGGKYDEIIAATALVVAAGVLFSRSGRQGE